IRPPATPSARRATRPRRIRSSTKGKRRCFASTTASSWENTRASRKRSRNGRGRKRSDELTTQETLEGRRHASSSARGVGATRSFPPARIFAGRHFLRRQPAGANGPHSDPEAPAGSPHLRHRRAVLANRLRAEDAGDAIRGDVRVVPEADEPRADPRALGKLRGAV